MKPETTQEGKNLLRDKLKKLRSQVDPALAESSSQGVWNVLGGLPEFEKAKGVGAFVSIPGEINTYPILEGTMALGKKLYLPKVTKDKSRFEFHEVRGLTHLEPGPFGILEPTQSHPAKWEEIDLILVPGLAFDLKGNRLGFGKGYYDRILPQLKKSALIIGLAYSFQVVEQVPVTTEDIPVAALLTEKGFHSCKK